MFLTRSSNEGDCVIENPLIVLFGVSYLLYSFCYGTDKRTKRTEKVLRWVEKQNL